MPIPDSQLQHHSPQHHSPEDPLIITPTHQSTHSLEHPLTRAQLTMAQLTMTTRYHCLVSSHSQLALVSSSWSPVPFRRSPFSQFCTNANANQKGSFGAGAGGWGLGAGASVNGPKPESSPAVHSSGIPESHSPPSDSPWGGTKSGPSLRCREKPTVTY